MRETAYKMVRVIMIFFLFFVVVSIVSNLIQSISNKYNLDQASLPAPAVNTQSLDHPGTNSKHPVESEDEDVYEQRQLRADANGSSTAPKY